MASPPPEDIALLKRMVAEGATVEETVSFLETRERTRNRKMQMRSMLNEEDYPLTSEQLQVKVCYIERTKQQERR